MEIRDAAGKPDEARSSSDASSGSHFSAPRCLDGGGVRSGGGSNGDGDGSSLGLGSPADWSATEEAFMSFSEAAAGGTPGNFCQRSDVTCCHVGLRLGLAPASVAAVALIHVGNKACALGLVSMLCAGDSILAAYGSAVGCHCLLLVLRSRATEHSP